MDTAVCYAGADSARVPLYRPRHARPPLPARIRAAAGRLVTAAGMAIALRGARLQAA
jgi:hypothetical protein